MVSNVKVALEIVRLSSRHGLGGVRLNPVQRFLNLQQKRAQSSLHSSEKRIAAKGFNPFALWHCQHPK